MTREARPVRRAVAGIDRRRARWCPGSRRARSGTPRRSGRCRSARPGPMMPSHQPTSPCPGPAGPAAWLSPVSACSTSTAFDASGASVAPRLVRDRDRARAGRRPRARAGASSNSVTNCRRPGSSPGRHAPVTGDGDACVTRRRAQRTLGGAEAGVEVGEDVVERLDADRQAHEVGRDAGGRLLLGRRAAGAWWSPGGSRGCARRRRWRGG